jgi:hypothetical protein
MESPHDCSAIIYRIGNHATNCEDGLGESLLVGLIPFAWEKYEVLAKPKTGPSGFFNKNMSNS